MSHHEIWKHCQSTSNVHAKVLQNLMMRLCLTEGTIMLLAVCNHALKTNGHWMRLR